MAGPLVIGAVILGRKRAAWDRLTDSKQLTRAQREELNKIILDKAAATGLGWLTSQEVDQYGLGQSLRYAARQAVTHLLQHSYPDQFAQLTSLDDLPATAELPFDEIVIDGTINFLANTPLGQTVTTLPKADFLVQEVSAASIIAKVARDNYMISIADQYPGYGFEQHVGYGTIQHYHALRELGVCPEHRRSFRPIQQLIDGTDPAEAPIATKSKTTTGLGQCAEYLVISYLQDRAHTLIAHNYKTKTYEIDIISYDAQNIYFTEVKYRKTAQHGTALAQVTPRKQQQMRYAAEAFLATHDEFRHLQPLLAVAAVSGPDFTIEGWLILQ